MYSCSRKRDIPKILCTNSSVALVGSVFDELFMHAELAEQFGTSYIMPSN